MNVRDECARAERDGGTDADARVGLARANRRATVTSGAHIKHPRVGFTRIQEDVKTVRENDGAMRGAERTAAGFPGANRRTASRARVRSP